jgi:hypothetical protein
MQFSRPTLNLTTYPFGLENGEYYNLSLLKDNNALLTLKLLSGILLTLAILGLFFYWFAITLKYEAVLYARTVNGIRKYFYEKLNNPDIELKIKALPTDTKKPKYSSIANPLLIIIAIVNTTYMILAFHYLNLFDHCYVYGLLLIFLITHIVINILVTKNQIKAYP